MGLKNSMGIVPISKLNITRQILTVAMAMDSFGKLILYLFKGLSQRWYAISAPALQIFSMMMILAMTEFERRRGVRSSVFQLVFWILICLTGFFVIWSQVILVTWEENMGVFVSSCVYYGLGFIQLLLCSAVDKLPIGGDEAITDFEVPDPFFSRSSFIRLFLLHSFRLIREGYKRSLKVSDLWDIRPQYHARNNWVTLQANWNSELHKSLSSGFEGKSSKLETGIPLLEKPKASGHLHSVNECQAMLYKPSLLKAILKTFRVYYMMIIALRALIEVFIFTSPVILRRIINLVESGDMTTSWEGYLCALLLFFLSISEAVLTSHAQLLHFTTNIKTRAAIMSMVYNKALKLSANSRRYSTLGEIVNLMAVDSLKYMELMHFIDMAWVLPVQVGLALYFLWGLLGPAALAGVAAFSCLAPIKFILGRANKNLQNKQMKYKDERIKLTNEILSGIKVLKLYAWELSFEDQVKQLREKEIKVMQLQALLNSAIHFIFSLGPFMIALVSFAVFVISSQDHILTAEVAFVSLAYFNILRAPLQTLPNLINNLIQMVVSHNRIMEFLLKEELDKDCIIREEATPGEPLCVRDGSFTWDPSSPPLIKNINLSVKEGSMVAIVGAVGAGKSSLLSALLGEMQKVNGKLHIKGSIAYVPQQAWIQQASLKDNILFNQPCDEGRYQKILHDCALLPDIDILPGRDLTEIGERGINLSGGQKLRVSLARAVYKDADIYFLDDPLSAVDSHVGKDIFDNVLGPKGHLGKKTRIIVTHSLWFLPQVDEIIMLDEGMIKERGTYQDLMEKQEVFADLMRSCENTSEAQQQDDVDSTEPWAESDHPSSLVTSGMNEADSYPIFRSWSFSSTKVDRATIGRISKHSASVGESNMLYRSNREMAKKSLTQSMSMMQQIQRESTAMAEYCMSRISLPANRVDEADAGQHEDAGKEIDTEAGNEWMDRKKGELVGEEQMEKGKVKLSVYTSYLRAIGKATGLLVGIISLGTICFNIGASVWLSHWSDTVSEGHIDPTLVNFTAGTPSLEGMGETVDQTYYLAIYALLGFFQALGSAMRYGLGMYAGLRASCVQHLNLLNSIMRSPMSFFDRTPLGRILNRFSGDIACMDSTLPIMWVTLVTLTFDVLGTVVLIGVVTPWSLIAWVVLGAVFVWIQMFYVATQRQTQRLLSINRSPVFAHFDESLSGMSTIRAYRLQEVFLSECQRRVDVWGRCAYFAINCNRWLSVMLNMVGSVVVFLSAVMVIRFRDQLSSGLVGLTLTYALTITGMLQMLVRHCAMIESQIVSVERIIQYLNLPQEASRYVKDTKPDEDWPQRGAIEVYDLEMRYREGLDLVLKGISFSIQPGEKIGVVGRTGAGKSSLTLALFRIIEAANGSITIDGVNIANIGLHDLRSKLTVIPQDPVLFSGTLRLNLDPLDIHTDNELWKALELAHLIEWVLRLPEGLSYVCSEGGENLSVGQRQLVCLARALLRHTQLLILDEATAGCDIETDELIQSTIRSEFNTSTVLTVAHRLNTIMDYDRILVLVKGRVAELDSPSSLLANKQSLFYSMAKDAGLAQ